MRNRAQLKARADELKNEIEKATAAYEGGRLETKRYKGIVNRIQDEAGEIQSELKAWDQVTQYSWGGEANYGTSPMPTGGFAEGDRISAASPMDLTAQQIHGLYAAARARSP